MEALDLTATTIILSTIIIRHHHPHHDNINQQQDEEHSPTIAQDPTPATSPTQLHSPSSSLSAYSSPTFTTPIITLNITTNVTLWRIAPPIMLASVKWPYRHLVIRRYYYRHLQRQSYPLHYCNYYTSIQVGETGTMSYIAMSHEHYYYLQI